MDKVQEAESVAAAPPRFDEAQMRYALDGLRSEQNLALGAAAGSVAALAGAGVWAVITIVTQFQIGWMAVGVGLLVGIAVRKFGKGVDKSFGITGAVLALLGCGVGNLLAVCGAVSSVRQIGYFQVLSMLNPTMVEELMVATFSPMDLLFYGLAAYEGYKLSFRPLTEQDIAARITGSPSGAARR